MGDGDSESLTSSPGARLQVARIQAGLSASEAAERLHVDQLTLDALESGHLEGMGASVFVRGHLRRYAELVGIPEAEIMTSYEAWSGRLAAQPDLRDVITGPAVRSGTRRFELHPRQALIGAIVVVLVGLIWWAMHKAPRTSSAAAAPVLPASPSPAGPAPPGPAPIVTPAPASVAPAPAVAAAPAAVSVPPPAIAATHSPTVATVATPATIAASASSEQMTLGLKFNADSWLDIEGADGTRLFHGLAQGGSHHHVTGSAPLRVFLGNPTAVALEMNGRPLAWNTASKATRPRRFLLDAGGRAVEVAPQP